MATEGTLEQLIKALDRNSAALEALNSKTGGGSASTGTTKASTPAAGGKKAKDLTIDDVAAAFGKYLKAGDDDDMALARENVKKILDHFGVKRATLIPPKNFAEAISLVGDFIAGNTPAVFADEGDGGDSADDLM